MTTPAPEQNWLLDPGRLKLVHQCRRLIHSEFGVKLHLTEDRLPQQLADFAGRTRSTQLVRTWDSLKHQIPGFDPEYPEGDRSRRYRGQRLADDIERSDRERVGVAAEPPRNKVIYRGQVVG
ncbi:hypothetical protein [Marinobacter xestospongiae]|uniref:Uncharacterized protein n=1 Tax=Marinobacter xestospongiae TaxID=994319 RepID=A0ABU3VWW7_9GAMM|nr:hypothetical protein [Marinobacter xestospongiae]MDV2078762.1 hypothetical protein [Marinobacter xestospongiae]